MKKVAKDKNKELLLRAKEGDVYSKELLIKEMEGLIVNTINGYLRVYNYLEYDDLYQEACKIILECIIDYDYNKETYFSGYVKNMLNYYFLDLNKYLKMDKNARIINKILKNDEGEIDILELIEDKKTNVENIYLEKELYKVIKENILRLPKRQKEVIKLYYHEGMTIDEISKKLLISSSTVKREKRRALYALRKNL